MMGIEVDGTTNVFCDKELDVSRINA
jgi:hypothetical protein